jgi:hypothetical protein
MPADNEYLPREARLELEVLPPIEPPALERKRRPYGPGFLLKITNPLTASPLPPGPYQNAAPDLGPHSSCSSSNQQSPSSACTPTAPVAASTATEASSNAAAAAADGLVRTDSLCGKRKADALVEQVGAPAASAPAPAGAPASSQSTPAVATAPSAPATAPATDQREPLYLSPVRVSLRISADGNVC